VFTGDAGSINDKSLDSGRYEFRMNDFEHVYPVVKYSSL
jgi:hypothetical protein